MKVTLESTSKVVTVDGVPARIWEGKTESGIAVIAFITRITNCADESRQEEFRAELEETRLPSAQAAAIPLKLIL